MLLTNETKKELRFFFEKDLFLKKQLNFHLNNIKKKSFKK